MQPADFANNLRSRHPLSHPQRRVTRYLCLLNQRVSLREFSTKSTRKTRVCFRVYAVS